MKFDIYSLTARVLPAFLSSVPFFLLNYFLLNPLMGDFWGELLALKIVSNITFSFALLFLLMQIDRIISKEFIEKNIYKNELYFPTTNFLLHLDKTFSSDFTRKIRQLICESVSLIRSRVEKGNLVGQHNAEYGFIRNLAGGNILAALASLINVIVFGFIYPNQLAFWISCATLFIYSLLALFSKKMIDAVGYRYAKVLIQEYMGNYESTNK